MMMPVAMSSPRWSRKPTDHLTPIANGIMMAKNNAN
jgi:hypothetical protein